MKLICAPSYLSLFLATAIAVSPGRRDSCPSGPRPKALVYRGPAACDGCPEAVAALLQSSPSAFDVEFCGPEEVIGINKTSLSGVQVYAQPGGGGKWTDPIFVHSPPSLYFP